MDKLLFKFLCIVISTVFSVSALASEGLTERSSADSSMHEGIMANTALANDESAMGRICESVLSDAAANDDKSEAEVSGRKVPVQASAIPKRFFRALHRVVLDDVTRALFYYGEVRPRETREMVDEAFVVDKKSGKSLRLNLSRLRTVQSLFNLRFNSELGLAQVISHFSRGEDYLPLNFLIDQLLMEEFKVDGSSNSTSGILAQEKQIQTVVAKELAAIRLRSNAKTWTNESGAKQNIDFNRLNQIRKIYGEMWQESLDLSHNSEFKLLTTIAVFQSQHLTGSIIRN